jgi:hypothetical protein
VLLAGSAHSEFADAAKSGILPGKEFYIGSNVILFGYHIHHFYFGIILLVIAGWLAIVERPYIKNRYLAVIYGVGLGLFLDEIGLLLTWGDYFSGLTYIITLFVLGVMCNIIFFPEFWKNVRKEIKAQKSGFLGSSFLNKNSPLFDWIDSLSSRMFKPEKLDNAFSAMVYILIALLVLLFPSFVQYIIGGGFIIEGMLILAKPIFPGGKNEIA